MAKSRMINTSFWSDPFIQDLNNNEKLLYLYFLTNERTSICGIYEITERTMAFDTGIELKKIKQTVDTLVHAGKIKRHKNWIYLLNFSKHQKSNPSVEQGIKRAIKELPEGIFDKLSTDSPQHGLLKPELKPELKDRESTPAQKMRTFINSIREKDIKYKNLLRNLQEKGISEAIGIVELDKFIDYWTEKNKSGTKERWEMEKTFEVERRLITWLSRIGGFDGKKKRKVTFIS